MRCVSNCLTFYCERFFAALIVTAQRLDSAEMIARFVLFGE